MTSATFLTSLPVVVIVNENPPRVHLRVCAEDLPEALRDAILPTRALEMIRGMYERREITLEVE